MLGATVGGVQEGSGIEIEASTVRLVGLGSMGRAPWGDARPLSLAETRTGGTHNLHRALPPRRLATAPLFLRESPIGMVVLGHHLGY